MNSDVRTAVIPAAGLGLRMRPATAAVPQELLPIGGHPAIDWVIEEVWACGLERAIVVTSPRKPALGSYLANRFAAGWRPTGLYERTPRHPHARSELEISVIEQSEPHGLGDAVRRGWKAATDDAVAVLLPDELMLGGAMLLSTMLEHHARTRTSVVSLLQVATEEVAAYGCAEIGGKNEFGALRARSCVEKPSPGRAPSDSVLSGRYVLEAGVLAALSSAGPDAKSEIQLIPALNAVARSGKLLGLRTLFTDSPFDAGSWPGWLDANHFAFGLEEWRPTPPYSLGEVA